MDSLLSHKLLTLLACVLVSISEGERDLRGGCCNCPNVAVAALAAAAKSLQSCLTLCDPTDGSPPGSPVPGILYLFLHGLESNPGSSLQTEEEAGLP